MPSRRLRGSADRLTSHALATLDGSLTPLHPFILHDVPDLSGCPRTCGEHVVAASGEIDLATAPQLQRRLLAGVEAHAAVCCDLGRVTFFSAAGITALMVAADRARQRGGRFRVRGAHGVTRRILLLAGAGDLLR